MKKMILALVAAMTMTTAMAQGEGRPERNGQRMDQTEMTKRRTDDAVKKYGLNEEQAAKLLQLNTKYADKLRPGMRGGRRGGGQGGQRPAPNFGGNMGNGQQGQFQMTDEMRKQMETMRKERQEALEKYDAELQEIMTPEQFKAYKADEEKRRQEGFQRMGGQRGNRPQQQ